MCLYLTWSVLYARNVCLHALWMEPFELRRLKVDLIVCFKMLTGFTNIIPSAFLCGRHAVLEVTAWNCIIRIPFVKFFSLFALSNYTINCQKKWYQQAVSVHLYRVCIQCMCHILTFCFSAACFFIYRRSVLLEPFCPVNTALLCLCW